MTDIVEKLRRLAEEHYEMLGDVHLPMRDAANQIERLRAALRPFACKCSSNCEWEMDEICLDWNARAALEGKP